MTASGFYSGDTGVATVSGSTVTGVAAGTATIYSEHYITPSDYDKVFDQKTETIHVNGSGPEPVVTYQYKVVTSVDPSSTTVGSSVVASADLYRKTFEDGVATTGWVYQGDVTSSGFNKQGGVSVSISGSSVTGNAAGDAYIRSNYSADEYEDAKVTFVPQEDVLQSIWFGSELTPSSNYDYGTLSIANDFTKSYRVWANYSLSGTREITYDPDLSISASNGVSWSGGTISKGTSQTGASTATASFNGKSNTAHVYVQHGYLLVSANVESTDIGVGSQFNLVVSGNFEETWGSGVMHNDEDFRNAGAISCTYHDSEVTVTVVSASQVRITFSNSISDGTHGITLQFKNRTGLNGTTDYDGNTVSVDFNFITEGGTARPVQ